MNFYKILNSEEVHMDMAYKTGYNKDIRDFEPDYGGGGIHFSREHILTFLNYGSWVRKVVIPVNANVWKYPDYLEQWKADSVILQDRRPLDTLTIIDLIEEGARCEQREFLTLLEKSAKENDPVLASYLFKNCYSWHDDKELHAEIEKIFLLAVKSNNCKVAKEFILYLPDINFDGGMALLVSCYCGHLKMVKLLVSAGAKYGEGCLLDAIKGGKSVALIRYLVEDLKIPVSFHAKIQPCRKDIRTILLNAYTL